MLASNQLSKSEELAFQRFVARIDEGEELTDHEKLWVETLNYKYLAK